MSDAIRPAELGGCRNFVGFATLRSRDRTKVANLIKMCRQPLKSVRRTVCYAVQCLHEEDFLYRHIVQGGGGPGHLPWVRRGAGRFHA